MPALKDPQYEKFASELAELKAPIEAYKLAGYAPHRGNATRLARRPEVRARVDELLEEAKEYADIRRVRVLVEIDRVGRGNQRDYYDAEGKLIPIQKLPRHLSAAIAYISFDADGAAQQYHLHDKNQANFTLLKHLGGLPEPERHDVNIFNLLSVEDQRVVVQALEALSGGQGAVGGSVEGEPVEA